MRVVMGFVGRSGAKSPKRHWGWRRRNSWKPNKNGSVWQLRRNDVKLCKKYKKTRKLCNKTSKKRNIFCNECNLIVFRTISTILKLETPMLLIVVTFLAGTTWGPTVATQALSSAASCTTSMNAVAQTILVTAKSNVNGKVLIENDGAGGLQITTGISQRIIASLACN